MSTQVFTSSGTWTCPTGVEAVVVECWGAGGGGGGGEFQTSFGYTGGGGGAGGAYAKSVIAVSAGTVYTVTVGTGGTGGAAVIESGSGGAGSGGSGGESWFDTETTIRATGGGGGGTGIAGFGGAASVGFSIGTITIYAEDGVTGTNSGSAPAAGGNGGGGVNASSAYNSGGAGGATGDGSTGTNSTGNDSAYSGSGGGGGAAVSSGLSGAGAAGGNGQVFLTWVVATNTTKTQSGKSRIRLHDTQTHTGVARIKVSGNLHTQSGKSHIFVLSLLTQAGKSRITAHTPQTQLGKANLKNTTLQTQTGNAAIQENTARTQSGLSRIDVVHLPTQSGVSRITATTLKTQSGKSAVGNNTAQTQAGVGRIVTPFTYNRSFTIDHTKCGSSSSSNFPVLLSISNQTWLKTLANGGRIQNTVSVNGATVPADLLFWSDSGFSEALNWEIEFYDGSAGTIVAWVMIPTVSHSSDTVFYGTYSIPTVTTWQGNVNGTWDSNFQGVWHFPDGTTLGTNDSTSNANNLTGVGTPTAASGQIDGAVGLDGATQYLKIAGSSSLNVADGITVGAWVKIEGLGGPK